MIDEPEDQRQEVTMDPMALQLQALLGETKREALQIGWPEPEEMKKRLPLITNVTGKGPNYIKAYKAEALWNIRLAIINKQPIEWDDINPVYFLLSHSPSINAATRRQLVEMVRVGNVSQQRRGLWDRLIGR